MQLVSLIIAHATVIASVTNANSPYKFHMVGAGFGRTGTRTLKEAINILGLGPTHHMSTIIGNITEFQSWIQVAKEKDPAVKEKLVRDIMISGGFHSACDHPSAPYFDSLMNTFPDSKVVLSVRDSPQAWIKSVRSSIMHFMSCHRPSMIDNPYKYFICPGLLVVQTVVPQFTLMKAMLKAVMMDHIGDGSDADMEKYYLDHIEHVKRIVPPHRLLIWKAAEGWDSLCKFLGVPIPTIPFPKVNEAAEFQRVMTIMACIGYGMVMLVLLLMWGLVRWMKSYVGKTHKNKTA